MSTTNPLAEKASVHSNQTESQVSLANKSVPKTTEKTGSFLDNSELANFCKTARFSHLACRQEMADRKLVSEELLSHVFKAIPSKVAEFLKKPQATRKMILQKTSYREGYLSKKLNKFVCFRYFRAISPLQAAARCGDNFLVLELLSHIANNDALRLEAAQQLQEILNQKNTSVLDNVKDISAVRNDNGNGDRKIKDEDRKRAADTMDFADNAEYLAPFKELLKAYNDYITQYPILSSQERWVEITKLWENIGECHKKLPRYGFQELFDNKYFWPIPEFATPPQRGACLFWNGDALNLDVLGCDGLVTLFKGRGQQLRCLKAASEDFGRLGVGARAIPLVQIDALAISHLSKVRQAELENIIICLKTPGAAIISRPAVKSVTEKPA